MIQESYATTLTPNLQTPTYFHTLALRLPPTPIFSIDNGDSSPQKTCTKTHNDIKARNRVAAKKWRAKKDSYLTELENENDTLRQEYLALTSQQQSIKVENSILEKELQFFQMFMSKIMKHPDFPES